ncbi:transcription factor MafB [Drosophila miranda]|uniref:Transcription factor MafB n=1 Tax=Drosophila pseudoobscura pseudoobscura TaxID=46245 RepID=B5DJ12_DROPS|nr:transcription factor MafB [Drosophila pseudoobscura]XP_017152060.1 transcription factor MafB [Drosophila miranda]XP_026844460.1 transcription factor MafB [Drosophila persimilis]
MERNNGRYPYIRRQGSGHNNYHHHHNNNANSTSSTAGSTNATQYSNHSINNSPSVGMSTGAHNSNAIYAAAVPPSQNVPISQHDELIRYIREAWNKVYEQGTPVYRNESDNQLKNFKPFNLEEYWGQRLVQNIHVTTTNASGHQ